MRVSSQAGAFWSARWWMGLALLLPAGGAVAQLPTELSPDAPAEASLEAVAPTDLRVRYVHHERIFVSAGRALGARPGQGGEIQFADGSERAFTLIACADHSCAATLAAGTRLPRPGDRVRLDRSQAPDLLPPSGDEVSPASRKKTPALHIERSFHAPPKGFVQVRFSDPSAGVGRIGRRPRRTLRGRATLASRAWSAFESSLPETFFEQNLLQLSLHGAPEGFERWGVDLEAQVIGQAKAPQLARDHPGSRVWLEVREASVSRALGAVPSLRLGRLRPEGPVDRTLDGAQLDLHRVIPGGLLSIRAGTLSEPISLRPRLDQPLLAVLANGGGTWQKVRLRWEAQASFLPQGGSDAAGGPSMAGAMRARGVLISPRLRLDTEMTLWAMNDAGQTAAIVEHASTDASLDAGEYGSFDLGARMLGDAVWAGDRAFFSRATFPEAFVLPAARNELDARWTRAIVQGDGITLRPKISAGVSFVPGTFSPLLAWGRLALLRTARSGLLRRVEGAYRFEAGWTGAHLLQLAITLRRFGGLRIDLDQEAGVRLLTADRQLASTGTTRLRLVWRLGPRFSLRAQTAIFYGEVGQGATGRLEVVARLP